MRNHKKLLQFLRPDPAVAAANDDGCSPLPSPTTSGSASTSATASPSPYVASPWVSLPGLGAGAALSAGAADETGLLGSFVKEDGHVYSLAAAGDLLYTGTDSKNVRVWRDRREFAGFHCGSGLVKAIVVAGDGRIYTGHQDGKIRVWRASAGDPAVHRRVGSLPKLGDFLRSSVRPSHYIETRRRHSSVGPAVLWLALSPSPPRRRPRPCLPRRSPPPPCPPCTLREGATGAAARGVCSQGRAEHLRWPCRTCARVGVVSLARPRSGPPAPPRR